MAPTIDGGTPLLVRARPRPRAGEVWAFVTDDGQVVVHRFWRRNDAGLVFRGDGNDHPDPPVDHDQLIGRIDLGPVDRLSGIGRLTTTAVRRRLSRS